MSREVVISDAALREIEQLKVEWDKTERYLKTAEQLNGEVIYPSIMELRYAGRRIAEAIGLLATGSEEPQAIARLQDAQFDCHRARHDAIDVGVAKIAIDLDAALDKLGPWAVSQGYPEFAELRNTLFDTQDRIAASRADRENRDVIYDVLENERFPEITRLYRDFLSRKGFIDSLATENATRRSRDRRLAIGGLVVGAIGLVVGLAGLLAAVLSG